MKKVLAAIFAFLYLSTSMGATIHVHFCMGKPISWGLTDRESKSCLNCGMPANNSGTNSVSTKSNCCHDESQQVKTDKDQKVPQSDFQFSKVFAEACVAVIVRLHLLRQRCRSKDQDHQAR